MEKKWIQITSGRGPAECQLLVAACYRDLLYRAEAAGLGLLLIHQDYDEKGKYLRSIVLRIEGPALSNWLKPWLGSIQWIFRGPLRPFHKRKNWFVGCFELEQQVLLTFDEHEVLFQTMRSSCHTSANWFCCAGDGHKITMAKQTDCYRPIEMAGLSSKLVC